MRSSSSHRRLMDNKMFTEEEKNEINSVTLNYHKAKGFMHCSYCLKQFNGSPLHESMTPREYGMYEVSSYTFSYPGGVKKDVVAVWCKRCGRPVWDSRLLEQMP